LKEHAPDLVNASNDGNLSDLWFTSVPNEKTVEAYIDFALKTLNEGTSLPYTVIENYSGKVIGSTRFCHAEIENRRLEIGYTWYAKSFQRSAVNTECKLLMLTHAFESLGAIAVEFRTHFHRLYLCCDLD